MKIPWISERPKEWPASCFDRNNHGILLLGPMCLIGYVCGDLRRTPIGNIGKARGTFCEDSRGRIRNAVCTIITKRRRKTITPTRRVLNGHRVSSTNIWGTTQVHGRHDVYNPQLCLMEKTQRIQTPTACHKESLSPINQPIPVFLVENCLLLVIFFLFIHELSISTVSEGRTYQRRLQ